MALLPTAHSLRSAPSARTFPAVPLELPVPPQLRHLRQEAVADLSLPLQRLQARHQPRGAVLQAQVGRHWAPSFQGQRDKGLLRCK